MPTQGEMMFIGLEDFDIDIFLRLDDSDIFIYYIDFETMPVLTNFVPLGSFDSEGKLLLNKIPIQDRVQVGLEFMLRDLYAEYHQGSQEPFIRADRFLNEFGNIPEIVEFFDPYLNRCDSDTPPDWCPDCLDTPDCPISIPSSEFLKIKGPGIKRFKVSVPTQDFIDSSVSYLAAEVHTTDETGDTYVGSAVEQFLIPSTPSPSGSTLGTEQLGSISTTSPTIKGLAINTQSTITVYFGTDSVSTVTKLNGEWEVEIGPVAPGINTARIESFSTIDGSLIQETLSYSVEPATAGIVPIGVVSNPTPSISGKAAGIQGHLEIIVEGVSYIAEPDPLGYWTITTRELQNPDQTIEVIFTAAADGIQYTETTTIVIDTTAVIVLDRINSGYINTPEHTQDLIVSGKVQGIEDGQTITTRLNGRKYYTNTDQNSFEVIIPAHEISALIDGELYQIEAWGRDLSGNIGRDTTQILIDLVKVHPVINIDPIEVGTEQYTTVSGVVSGDAKVGDTIKVRLNNNTVVGYVYEDTKYPGNNQGYDIDYSDLYYLVVVYFNGIYRTSPQKVQNFGTYSLLSDINFELNNYSMVLNVKEFFTTQFKNFLKTIPGSIPFASEYGTTIKLVVQTKNFIVQQLEVQAEINRFISNFNNIYGELVIVKDIKLISQESSVGADSWVIEVYASIQKDRLVYRLEI